MQVEIRRYIVNVSEVVVAEILITGDDAKEVAEAVNTALSTIKVK